MKIIGIYKITSPSGRIYIGQSVDFKRRYSEYENLNNIIGQTRLYNSFVKYGAENHVIEFIEECKFPQLNIVERKWQDYYNVIGKNGLNCVLTKTDELPRVVCEETRIKISNGNKGRIVSQKTRNKLSKIHKGRKCSEETKIKLSKSNTGKTMSLEAREKLSKINIGKKHTEESKKKMSESKKGKYSEETLRKYSIVKLGKLNAMYGKKGKDNPASKKVIDTELNIIYDSLIECCKLNNLNYKYMSNMLTNTKPNNTKYKYA